MYSEILIDQRRFHKSIPRREEIKNNNTRNKVYVVLTEA